MKYYFIDPEYYQNINIYSHFNVKEKLKKALEKNDYNEIQIKKILEDNFKEKILKRL